MLNIAVGQPVGKWRNRAMEHSIETQIRAGTGDLVENDMGAREKRE